VARVVVVEGNMPNCQAVQLVHVFIGPFAQPSACQYAPRPVLRALRPLPSSPRRLTCPQRRLTASHPRLITPDVTVTHSAALHACTHMDSPPLSAHRGGVNRFESCAADLIVGGTDTLPRMFPSIGSCSSFVNVVRRDG